MKYFKNVTSTSADLYIYGNIVDEKTADWFTGEVSKTDIDTIEFKEELEKLNGITDLNIYINSGGGNVFAASAMVSMLKRLKTDKGIKIHSFIDGICASAATYLAMVADEINCYKNSLMMIHKPMTMSIGNANDLQKDIDTLNSIEDNVMLPMYMDKSKVDEDTMKNLINDETWFSADEKDDNFIDKFFKVNLLDKSKEVTACISQDMFKNYKHVPESVKNYVPRQQKVVKDKEVEDTSKENRIEIDYSVFEKKLSSLKKGLSD